MRLRQGIGKLLLGWIQGGAFMYEDILLQSLGIVQPLIQPHTVRHLGRVPKPLPGTNC